jgi:predicted nucleic-acid-binding protein
MIGLDTNVLVRYIMQDDAKQSHCCYVRRPLLSIAPTR